MVTRSDELSLMEQQMLLAIMRLHPNAYGLTIKDEIRQRTGKDHSVGTIYAALERLEDKSFIKSRECAPEAKRGGRRKLFFTVTPSGRAALDASLKAVDSLRNGTQWQGALA